MFKTIFIIGKGSAGQKHYNILRNINRKFKLIHVSSRRFEIDYKRNNYLKLKKINPNYFIISSPASFHFKHLNIIEKNFKKKSVLVEKPLFDKDYKIKLKNNKYFVGFNLRFNPVLNYIKKMIKNKKIYFVNINCSSFMPHWRKNYNYKDSVGAQRKLGGGVLLELSHELDYIIWLFGYVNILYAFNKKISDLKINTDDILCLNITNKNKTFINLTINFFSKIRKREIYLEGKNISIHGDIINNKITFIKKKKRTISWSKYKSIDSYKAEHLNIIKLNKEKLCSISEAQKVQNLISRIKKNL